MFFPSLYSGISGLARSVNQVCRLASFKVARAGNLKVEGLGASNSRGEINEQTGLLDNYLRYRGYTFVTTSEDQREHILKFRHDALSECTGDHVLRTPRLCLQNVRQLSVRRYPRSLLAKGSPTEAEGIAIPFLTFDWERMSSS